MKKDELTAFRSQIETEIAELTAGSDLVRAARGVVELDQQSVGRLSRMDALQQQAMAQAQEARRQAEITRLRHALQRLEAGTFGYCDDCGDAIGAERLRLSPVVTRCRDCMG